MSIQHTSIFIFIRVEPSSTARLYDTHLLTIFHNIQDVPAYLMLVCDTFAMSKVSSQLEVLRPNNRSTEELR